MAEDDRAYYARRAQQERERAGRSEDSSVALAHLKLADAYERRAAGEPIRLPLSA